MTVETQQFYYNLLPQGYMFRRLRIIIILGRFIRGPDDDSEESTYVALR